MWLEIIKKLRTASLDSKFTDSSKKCCRHIMFVVQAELLELS